jgi:hypothetical protein
MGWIENGPKAFLKPNFIRQGLPAKSQMVPFRLNSLKYENLEASAIDRFARFPKKTGVMWNLALTGSYDNIGIVLRTGFYVQEPRYREKL